MSHRIEQIDTTSAPERVLHQLAEYYVLVDADEIPDDPPTPVEEQVAYWRNVTPHHPQVRWILWDDEGIGAAAIAAYSTEQNLENGYGRIHVRSEKRGRGYARALATPLFDHLESAGRHRLDTLIKKDSPAEGLARRLGLKSAFEEKRSRLVVSELDMDLMDSWIERARQRAAEYELVYHQSPLPDEIVQKFCDLAYVMNTAPREDMVEEDEVLTPEMWRELESSVIDAKGRLHNLIAVHRPSGDFVGYTQIKTQRFQPDLAWNWDTAVDPNHRNKGLGRWLKATMIQRVLSDHPDVERVDTFNAGSNEPMLKINIDMGFRPVHIANVWQGELATARERLDV